MKNFSNVYGIRVMQFKKNEIIWFLRLAYIKMDRNIYCLEDVSVPPLYYKRNMIYVVKLLSHVWLFAAHGLQQSGFSVLHCLPELAQIHVHWVHDAIQPSHPLLPHSTPALNLSQHQSLFQWVGSFFFFLISWRLITLQYCSGFCHTLTWISRGYTCIPHPNPPSHLPLHPIPLGLPSAPGPSTCLMHPTWAGDPFHPR